MVVATLSPCRHRSEEIAPGVARCGSPKLVGLKMVTATVCAACYCRDHVLDADEQPQQLYTCAYLGAALSSESGEHLCRHPSHGVTTPTQCLSCPDYLFPLLTPRTPTADIRTLLKLPLRVQPAGWWTWPAVQDAVAEGADQFLRDLPPYPTGTFAGRGVVIVGGGSYFPSVYVTVRALRHVCCALPIRVYSFGRSGEMPPDWAALLAPYGVTCIDLDDPSTRFPFPEGVAPTDPTERGWAAKVRAILDSPFEEVLFLDADSYPCRNPEFLFDHPAYRNTGAIFWHDIFHDGRLDWDAFRVTPPPPSGSVESGEIIIHKRTCWVPLLLGWWYASHHAATFRWGYGDKHVCFELPWAKLGRQYTSFADRGPWVTCAFLQPGPDGEPVFVHRCKDKFRFSGQLMGITPQCHESNMYCRELPLEAEAFGWMAELMQAVRVQRTVLNLGCGNRPVWGAHNHDRRAHGPFVDTAHDLERIPWPWPDGSFDRVIADDVLEHLDDVVAFMDEAHRILRPGGSLRVRVPHYQSEQAVIDPTHRRGFHPRSLEFFTREGYGANCVYTDRRWRILRHWQERYSGGLNLLWELQPLTLPKGNSCPHDDRRQR